MSWVSAPIYGNKLEYRKNYPIISWLLVLVCLVYLLIPKTMYESNMMLAGEYLSFLLDMRWLTEWTIDVRNKHLRTFFEFIGNKKFKKITLKDIRDYVLFLKSKKRGSHSRYHHEWKWTLSLMTVQNYISTLRHFYKRSTSMWYQSIIIPELIQSPKVSRKKINALSDNELELILRAPIEVEERKDIMYRNFLLILVGYLLWLRIWEALSLNFDQVLDPSQILTIIGKWRKERRLFVPKIIQTVAKEYQKIRGWFILVKRKNKKYWPDYVYTRSVEDKNPNLIFTCLDRVKYGEPLKRPSTSAFFRRYEKAMWLEKRITFHRLRHTFWRHLLNNNVDLYTLQHLLGHETILATQYYVEPDDKKIINAQLGLLPKVEVSPSMNMRILQALQF